MNATPKIANSPLKEVAPDDPSRDQNHDESRVNAYDEETARKMGNLPQKGTDAANTPEP
ncbi:hypothetical protein [Luteolibacter luteus]|uniref:Uncharacterized protein n=1 Tax=Luteolibacter luteus TaxID=2728835 RepID=A0A858RK74_9BACT|nr:hypothetical protein [Luteolibacter luteus]QJE96858.1 hypothetical protein HHL09_14045 [Luteolibacter luteus]